MNQTGIRILSAAILATIAIGALVLGTPFFELLALIAGGAILWEWWRIVGKDAKMTALGLLFVAVVLVSTVVVFRQGGAAIIAWLFSVVWATDIGAYFGGRYFGGSKLAPKISPNKTRSGSLSGLLLALVVGVLVGLMLLEAPVWLLVICSLVLSVIGQLGDLAQSFLKRRYGVKDSSNLIPGHGGVFDRLDSFSATVLPLALLSPALAG